MVMRSAQTIHESLLNSILRCGMLFFESTPIGRILNRFSKDVESIEKEIPEYFSQLIKALLSVLSVVVVISITWSFFLIFFIPICVAYVLVQVN